MVKIHEKIWANYEQLKSIIGYYIALFCVLPLILILLSMIATGEVINSGEWSIIKPALIRGLKWAAIIMPIITALFVVWFLFYTDTVVFLDDSIVYYRWIFSKEGRTISYNEITECVFNDGLWKHNGRYITGRFILIYNKNKLILKMGLYYKLCQAIAIRLFDKELGLIDEDCKLKSIDDYFKVDFMSLSDGEQLAILKYYCKLMQGKYRTAEEILSMDDCTKQIKN